MTSAGHVLLILGLTLLAASVGALSAGLAGRHQRAMRIGLWLVWAAAAAVLVAAVILLRALLVGDTGFAYVLENWHPSLSTPYRVAAFWAGAQGSLLFWVSLLTLATAVVAGRSLRPPVASGSAGHGGPAAGRRSRATGAASTVDALGAGAVLTLAAVAVFLVALMVFDTSSNPFVAAPIPAPPPAGLNPLLLHPAMALHPPTLFLGYVGLAIPFAFAMSALAGGRLDSVWTRRSRGWLLGGWLFLSLGIGLGAWWAYVILSWGGYWGWDPVENTSLVPWMTATGVLHAFSVYRRAPVFRRWAVVLAILTFWFTILATWTTRSGVVASVHAFERRSLLVVVLSLLLGVVAAAGVALVVARWRAIGDGSSPDGSIMGSVEPGPRDVMHEITDVALTAFAAAVAFATVAMPVLFGQTVRPETYDTLARPLGILTVAGLGLCPLLARGGDDRPGLLMRLAPPAVTAAIAIAVLAAAGWGGSLGGLSGLGACVFAGVASLEWLWLRARRAAASDGILTGLGRALTGGRGAVGGLVAHLGMAVLLAGLIGSGLYEQEAQLDLADGASVAVGGYALTVLGVDTRSIEQDGERVIVGMAVERDGRRVGVGEPALDHYAGSGQTVARAAIVGTTWRDVFISPVSFADEAVSVHVIVFPLIRFVWVGSGMLVVGAGIALLPRRRRAGPTVAAVASGAGD